jgi:hypothetical protein
LKFEFAFAYFELHTYFEFQLTRVILNLSYSFVFESRYSFLSEYHHQILSHFYHPGSDSAASRRKYVLTEAEAQDEARRIRECFARENFDPNFNWEEAYASGFDIHNDQF